MTEIEKFQAMVDEDIRQGQMLWDAYAHDADKMAVVFTHLFNRYRYKIEGFSEGLWVIQPYEDVADTARVYRNNVALVLERLEGFRENEYSNHGLMQYYMKKEHQEVNYSTDFTQVRMELGMMEEMSVLEKEEIMEHLDQMEEICALVTFRREKWNMLRQHLVWISGKDIDVAMRILPLFFKIS